MRSIVRGVVAIFAAFCIMDVAKAAPTIVSPADYSAFSTYSLAFKEILEEGSLGPDAYVSSTWSNPYFSYTDYSSGATAATSKRVADRLLMRDNALPVTLKWAGSAGQVVVKLWRTKKDSANNPQFTVTTTGTSAKFYDLEFGRNYTWTVTDSTGTATGHFYITNDSGAPRILLYDHDPDASGADTSNTRDMGGWRTTNGKVVKQGLIYRTAELEWCNPTDANGMRQELTYLKNTLGIKFDMDFRNYANLQGSGKYDLGYVGEASITKHGWKWAWKNGSYLNLNESNIGEGVVRLNINKLTGVQFGSYTELIPKKTATATENKNNRKNVWCAFTNLANSANWPMVFHCSHGKDRAGTFALVIQGVLGVPKEAALKDYAISWFDSPDEKLNYLSISNTCANLATYHTEKNGKESTLSAVNFQAQCVNFLVQCGNDAGLSENTVKSKITAFQTAMLEDPEMPDLDPNLTSAPETDGDTFTYVNLYHRRHAGGGGVASTNDAKTELSYMYTTETGETTHPAPSKFDNYDVCLYFYPTAGLPYSTPVGAYYKVGKVVSNGYYSPSAVGPYSFKFYFSSADHSKSDRTIIEHRAGVGKYENVDLYFTKYDSSNLGEGGRNLAYVYTGSSAAIEVWANATMRIMDMRDMSQLRSTKGYKAYIKFPKGRCANARLEALETDRGDRCSLGWFTGGEAGTRQYMKVSNTLLEFNAPNKTSTVEGSLGLEFSLGSVNTTSSQAMLKVADKLVIPAGSTITVNAGRKGAGTYRLIQAGTLIDNANLTLRTNYKVDNCKIGYYGTIVNDGNNLNLVVQEGEPPEEDPEDIGDADEGDWGYRVRGLGALKNETALVFTNSAKTANWVVPSNLENVQFLVVGGGGGGGGAVNSTKGGAGGAGGGGGCVVTGIVNKLEENTVITVGVGGGGNGGLYDTSSGSAYHGTNSYFKVGDVTYVTAYGGAGDLGYNKNSGVNNGSNSGSRYNGTTGSAAVGTAATWDQTTLSDKLSNVATFRHKGGNNANNKTYSSGGGGGATEDGKAPGSSSYGGDGGKGLTSSITGVEKMYGSGGSGATAKNGGYDKTAPEGAGSSYAKQNATNHGGDGADNQGGGGGGGGYQGNGGKGGSGIVVFRYTLKSEVKVDAAEYIESKIANKVYTGSLLMSGLTEDAAYTISEEGGVNVGEYTVTVTLKSGFVWADGNTSSTSNFTWKITQHENKWATEPLLSVTSWAQGYASNVKFVAPVQTVGELNATITTNGVTEAFSGRLPTEPGEYTINYSVVGTDNYAGRTWSASFKIYRSEPINGGYKVFGLGEKGNEEAMVFTQSGTWTPDKSLNNVQFLVVGGGGGGGADASSTEGNPLQGGAGGGGGGVVTGLVNFVNGQTVAITVGTGGLGGIAGDNTSGKYGAAQSQATDSSFGIGNVTYVTAVAGGGDSGSTSKSYNADLAGSNGGSGSGGRPNMASGNADTENLNLTYIVCGDKLGNNGGSGCTTAWDGYGYAAAGGGGGAVHAGQPGYVDSTTGNYNGGNGGEGYLSDITGTELVYGSGGGGGTVKGGSVGGKGGTGAGDGVAGGNAASAVPNQGGGGGGGGRAGNGGNGGSGIVVFRYIVDTTPTVGGIEVKVDANGVITNITTACYDFIVAGDLSNYKFADYYTASVADDGKLKIALNPKVATPVISETASNNDDAIVVTDDAVALGVTNAKVGLYYSVEAYSDPTCAGDPISATTPIPAACETLSLQIDKPNADAAFFKIVVTDIPSAE